ncbi:hypothetical protein VIGAN_01282200, partial [Vigna angularis var. angularis]
NGYEYFWSVSNSIFFISSLITSYQTSLISFEFGPMGMKHGILGLFQIASLISSLITSYQTNLILFSQSISP